MRLTSPYVGQSLYRLKSNHFPIWNRLANNRSCPHPECSSQSYFLVLPGFWSCWVAKRRWWHLLRIWHVIGLASIDADAIATILAFERMVTPPNAWQIRSATLATHERALEAHTVVHDATNQLWSFIIATTIYAIWIERLSRMEDPALSEASHDVIAVAGLRQSITLLQRSSYQSKVILWKLTRSRRSQQNFSGMLKYQFYAYSNNENGLRLLCAVFCFDGGFRRGSGSVIVRVQTCSHAAQIEWIASISLRATPTTNNVAEYTGLIHGLRPRLLLRRPAEEAQASSSRVRSPNGPSSGIARLGIF
ncbi:TPA: hypothetical protein N0F65_000221 [Lagenidium giganteum]|uniref:Uncharacterized protein n=1 Tax=Lagenidium giganteum TaxID=4803 RepID=A0AAV2YA02_9STRA|nr:TPA: hypothetical protein N0F65_000221 [Lagenidium giganteum]